MKILSIQFKNINNLKGEHQTIRFDKDPLSSAGIFAITGPTGSGKSTLLDVITLSLFNKIPRYKKAISKKEIDDLGSVVTHHTNDAYAKVEYEIENNRFISEWKVSKNRNGKLKDYEMYLYDATGQPLDLKKSEVPTKNEELIGLQYDQFVKSIILSQGEFSRFLKAEQNERGQLLENITGTSIYRKIGKKVFEKQREVKAQLETKKEILQNFQTLSEDEIKVVKEELNEITDKKKIYDASIKLLTENVQIKKDLSQSKSKIEDLQIAARDLISKKESFKSSLNKLHVHNKLAPVRGDIELYKDAENNRVKTKKNLSEYEAQISEAKKGFELSISQMANLSKKEVNQDNFMTVMKAFENEIQSIDKDIHNSISRGKELREAINRQKENFPHQLDKSPEIALSSIIERIQKLDDILSKSNLTLKSSTTEHKAKLKHKKEYYDILLLVKHELEHFKETQQKLTRAEAKLKVKKNEIELKTPLKEKSEKLLTSYHDQITTLRKRKEDALKIANFEEHRAALNEGDACPLCGSTDHPYSDHKPDSEFSEIEKQIEKVNINIEAQRKELDSINKYLTESNTNINLISEEIIQHNQQLTESEESLKLKKEKISNPLDIKKIEQTVKSLSTEIVTLEQSLEALEEIKVANELKVSFTKLDKEVKKHSQLKKERISKFDGETITDKTDQIQNSFERNRTSIKVLTDAIGKETKDLQRAIDTSKKHESKLKVKLEALGFNSIDEMSQNLLDENEALEIVDKENELKRLFTENETQLKSLKENVSKLSAADKTPDRTFDELSQELSQKEIIREETNIQIGEKTNQLKNDEENKMKQKGHISEIEHLTKDFEKWDLLSKMIGDSNGHKFANFSQGLTLQNLLVYANHRLINLSERYLLDKPKDGGHLRVVDQFQGNTHRAVSTLSGGESFLISLALALSLSDMASKNVTLESLFIDEGFGTLDQETLDVAMNTLEKLQSESNKMVGVISHVEALKERITVQIKLEKNAQGFSQLKIIDDSNDQ